MASTSAAMARAWGSRSPRMSASRSGGVHPFGGQDGVQVPGGEAAVHSGMSECPADIGAAGQGGQFHGVGHLLHDAFGADGGGFFEPYRRTRPQRQEAPFTGGAGTHAIVTGDLVVVVGEMGVVDGRAARGGAAVAGLLE